MDRLKTICIAANIVLMLFAAIVCVIGAVMGAGWTRGFFGAIPGESLLISIGLLAAAMVLEFWNGGKVRLTIRMWFKWRKSDILIAVLLLGVLIFIFYS
ncbi:MAG TPA: hypothetical protein DCP47_02250, partial [Phycisphaerales bacterium]|nr:hypothetical protein [Phycisphaerales bacterium]